MRDTTDGKPRHTIAWDVYLHGKWFDTVFWNSHADGGAPIDADEVKRSLVGHDGYNSEISVRKHRMIGG